MILMGLPTSHVEHSIAKPFLDKVAAVSFFLKLRNSRENIEKISGCFAIFQNSML